eukprot:scaffold4659_cov125-Isochrysis_galbana.AAC.5
MHAEFFFVYTQDKEEPTAKVARLNYRPRSDDRYVGAPSALRLYSPKRFELRFVYQSINPSQSLIDHLVRLVLVNRIRKISVTQHSTPSRQSAVGHGSARRSRDVCDRARHRFVSLSSVYSVHVQPSIRQPVVLIAKRVRYGGGAAAAA